MPQPLRFLAAGLLLGLLAAAAGCGGHTPSAPVDPHTDPGTGPAAGNPDAPCAVPVDGQAEDVSTPTTVVGTGTRESCTGEAFVAAVEAGGVITFSCGPDPVIITVPRTAKVRNDHGPRVVIDGGGKVTLSGAGARRILYMNTCDPAQVWTSDHCQDQDTPRLTVQNITFVDGNSAGASPDLLLSGGGAVFARGGRFKAVNARFFNNRCELDGPEVGGGALRIFSQYQRLPVYVVNSTFGGSARLGNSGASGGALSSIDVSWTVINSLFVDNTAVAGGRSACGGAIYNDGDAMTLRLCGVRMSGNTARAGGGAVFFVSNNQSGHLEIADSALSGNTSGLFETQGYPGIFFVGAGTPSVTNSTIE